MQTFGIILISLAVIAVTVMLFIGWVIYKVISMIAQSVSAGRQPPRLVTAIRQRIRPVPGQQCCARENCQNLNPPAARFCKCCGAALQSAETRSSRSPSKLPVRMSA